MIKANWLAAYDTSIYTKRQNIDHYRQKLSAYCLFVLSAILALKKMIQYPERVEIEFYFESKEAK
jgi:hypothetical protein